jgi:hypothetical protein
VVGPGFEIAVRGGPRSPFDVQVDRPRQAPERARSARGGRADEETMESIRDALQLLVEQVAAMEARVNLALTSARGGRANR